MKLVIKIIGLLLFVSSLTTSAQSGFSMQLTQHNGNLLAITNQFPASEFSTVTEFNFNFHTNGLKSWHSSYFNPRIGCSIAFQQFGNWEILGGGISLQPNVALQKQFGKGWSIESRTGLGIAFFNRPHNALTNPTNTVFGSVITAAFSEFVGIYKNIGNFGIHAGASIWHWSNGHTSVPNVGGNFMGYSFGVLYKIKEPSKKPVKPTRWDTINKKIHLDIAISTGIHEIEGTFTPVDGPKYTVYTLTLGATKRIGNVEKLTLGIDYNYYTAYHEQIVNLEMFESDYRLNSSNVVAFIGNEFLFGRLAFISHIGVNIYTPFRKKMAETAKFKSQMAKTLYVYSTNKIGFRYYWSKDYQQINKRLYTEVNLKTIFGKADFIQFKIGYNL
ncbi:MAG: hypothetical protein JKY42_07025 [Flavobacteriales bacterium]|nr:hypothetical protein [Flavobacteriales bacterium]